MMGILRTIAILLLTAVLSGASGVAATADGTRISGPYAHENLSIYLVHREDVAADDPVLTLDAALRAGKVVVHETGNVNELSVENVSKHETVFLQAGDIVKGGRQDRVLSQDLVLQPRSGRVPIAAFCVEAGRWSPRGDEAAGSFQSSKHSLASKELKLAARQAADQGEVWRRVSELQEKLGRATGAPVANPQSQTSLQLSLENGRLAGSVAEYEKALGTLPSRHHDVVGFASAINGRISAAEVYATQELFHDLWPKLLTATATEALAERPAATPAAPPPPDADGMARFLEEAQEGERDDALFFESRKDDDEGSWLHRSYLAK